MTVTPARPRTILPNRFAVSTKRRVGGPASDTIHTVYAIVSGVDMEEGYGSSGLANLARRNNWTLNWLYADENSHLDPRFYTTIEITQVTRTNVALTGVYGQKILENFLKTCRKYGTVESHGYNTHARGDWTDELPDEYELPRTEEVILIGRQYKIAR